MNQDSLVLAISLAVLAGVAAYWLLKQRKMRRSRSWPTAPGQVESTDTRLRSTGPQQSKWYATVGYSYTVQGTAYSGTLQRTFMMKGSADKWIRKYARGGPLSLRYNPEKPKDSVLHEDEQPTAALEPEQRPS